MSLHISVAIYSCTHHTNTHTKNTYVSPSTSPLYPFFYTSAELSTASRSPDSTPNLPKICNKCLLFHSFVPLHYVSHLTHTAETALTQPRTVLETVCIARSLPRERKMPSQKRKWFIIMICLTDTFEAHSVFMEIQHMTKNGILKSSMSYVKYYFGSTCGSFGCKEIRAFFCFYHQRLFLYIYNRWEENSVFCNYSLL